MVFGRAAMGERFAQGLVHDEWRIWRGGRLVWADALHIEGDFAAMADAPFGFGGARSVATIVYVGADAADHLISPARLRPRPVAGPPVSMACSSCA